MPREEGIKHIQEILLGCDSTCPITKALEFQGVEKVMDFICCDNYGIQNWEYKPTADAAPTLLSSDLAEELQMVHGFFVNVLCDKGGPLTEDEILSLTVDHLTAWQFRARNWYSRTPTHVTFPSKPVDIENDMDANASTDLDHADADADADDTAPLDADTALDHADIAATDLEHANVAATDLDHANVAAAVLNNDVAAAILDPNIVATERGSPIRAKDGNGFDNLEPCVAMDGEHETGLSDNLEPCVAMDGEHETGLSDAFVDEEPGMGYLRASTPSILEPPEATEPSSLFQACSNDLFARSAGNPSSFDDDNGPDVIIFVPSNKNDPCSPLAATDCP